MLSPDPNYPSPDTEQQAPPPDETDSEAPSALLPKSLVGDDAQVGQTITLKVVAIHGDEVSVAAAGEETEPKTIDKAESELDAMAAEE